MSVDPPISDKEVEWAVASLAKNPQSKASRNGEIFKARERGRTWSDIGRQFGIRGESAKHAYAKIYRRCLSRRKRNSAIWPALIKAAPLTPFEVVKDWQAWTPEDQAREFRCI